MPKHSPTPWKRGTDGLIFDANNEYVTDTCGTSLPEGEANQKLIVHTVNCYEDLLEACKASVAEITGGSMFPESHYLNSDRLLVALKAAVAKAEGKE